MKTKHLIIQSSVRSFLGWLALLALVSTIHYLPSRALAQGTAFSYQGQLSAGGKLANGIYDLQFSLYDTLSGANRVAGPITNSVVTLSNGLFTTSIDFGTGVFNGRALWLEIGARTNATGSFVILTPRQALTPAPYALFAPAAGAASTASNVVLGAVCAPNLHTPVNPLPGQVLAYDGSSLTWTNPSATSGAWLLGGNTGTSPGANFLGTTDSQAVEVRVNGQRALCVRPTSGGPNLIGGFSGNSAGSNCVGATIAGGGNAGAPNNIGASEWSQSSSCSSIGGGAGNTISWASESTIAGGYGNYVSTDCATISGGQSNSITAGMSPYCAIGGGSNNRISGDMSGNSTIAGGWFNCIHYGAFSAVGGGFTNLVDSFDFSVIAGGERNRIGDFMRGQQYGSGATIGGGGDNFILQDGATIGGGCGNAILGKLPYWSWDNGAGTIAGGANNLILSGLATIAGGSANTILSDADYSSIGGGQSNSVSGVYGVVPGGVGNTAQGDYSFAAGYLAQAVHSGSFVWASGNTTNYTSDDTNTFNIYAAGGVLVHYGGQDAQGIPQKWIVLASRMSGKVINVYNGAYLSTTGVWTDNSDRNAKHNFSPVDGKAILERVAELPITSWNYKSDDSVKHIGPVAQDFHAAFGVGQDEKHIAALDSAGIALAAIQGLNQKLNQKDAEIQNLKQQNDLLARRLNELEVMVKQLVTKD